MIRGLIWIADWIDDCLLKKKMICGVVCSGDGGAGVSETRTAVYCEPPRIESGAGSEHGLFFDRINRIKADS